MSDFLCSQIPVVKAQIVAYQDAITALSMANGVKEYRLDTGQTITTVKREDLDRLQRVIDSLTNRLSTLELRCGRRASYGRPGI